MRLSPRFFALSVTLYFLVLAVVYARAIPVFEAADEGPHFLYVHNLLEDRALPRILSREEVSGQEELHRLWAIESHQPPLYYAFGALLIAWSSRDDLPAYMRSNPVIFIRGHTESNPNKWLHTPDRADGDTFTAVMVLRAFSMALGVVTLWCVYLTARLIFAGALLPLLTMLATASIPTFITVNASVSNDNMVTALYSAGIYLTVRTWHHRAIRRTEFVLLCLVLAFIPLAKLTGVSLFAVVFMALIAGALWGVYPRRRVLQFVLSALILTMVVSGWWYIRNWSLYGDPLALDATRSLWGRTYEIAAASGDPLAELQRIARSFWMMVGHLHEPVYGPGWFYIYAAVLTAGAFIGMQIGWWRPYRRVALVADRGVLVLLLWVCVLVFIMLLMGTHSVDISYGRLLFPALAGFVPLLIFGLARILQRWLVPLALLPLVLMALITPQVIRSAYSRLVPLNDITPSARLVNVAAESLTLLAYEVRQDVVAPEESILVDLYLQGSHPENPFLHITAVDSVTRTRLGSTELFPGMAPTDALNPQQIYRASVRVPVDEIGPDGMRPRRIDLQLMWTVAESGRTLAGDLPTRLLTGPVLIDRRYIPGVPERRTNLRFGGNITLQGFDLVSAAEPGGDIPVTFYWRSITPLDDNWITAVQIIDAEGQIMAQADGTVSGYPTTMWVPRVSFAETRIITLPPDASPGIYRIVVGWYRLSDMARLPATGQGIIRDDLVILPETVGVE